MQNERPLRARDTHQPLIVLDGYPVSEDGSVIRQYTDTQHSGDHGADPLGNGMFRMVPSGDIVNDSERQRRLS